MSKDTRNMNVLRIALLLLGLILNTCHGDFRIAGYLPDYRIDGINLNATVELLDDLYLFSLMTQPQLDENMLAACCLQDTHFVKAKQAKAHNPSLKLWVTIGGGGRSYKFTKNTQAMFTALIKLSQEHDLDGIDFDCEEFYTHQDYIDYEKLVQNAAKLLQRHGVQVSVALHYGQTMSKDVYKRINRINLMSYDIPGVTYHADISKVKDGVQKLIESGCNRGKIFLGIPVYGRHKYSSTDVKTYAELVDETIMSSNTKISSLSDLHSMNTLGMYYTVDSPSAVSEKVKYAFNEQLGGIFFWELGQDKPITDDNNTGPGMLLSAAYESRKQQLYTYMEQQDYDENYYNEEEDDDEVDDNEILINNIDNDDKKDDVDETKDEL